MTTKYKITRAKGGTAERKELLVSVEVPDLWHHQEPSGQVLECWHLAHDLKRELIDARVELEALKKKARK